MNTDSSLVASSPVVVSSRAAVDGHEQVRPRPVDLRALSVEERVLDRHRVQAELVLQHQQVVLVGSRRSSRIVGVVVGEVVAVGDRSPAGSAGHPVTPVRAWHRVSDSLQIAAGRRYGVAAVERAVACRHGPELTAERTGETCRTALSPWGPSRFAVDRSRIPPFPPSRCQSHVGEGSVT